jgi:hypothetical protein
MPLEGARLDVEQLCSDACAIALFFTEAPRDPLAPLENIAHSAIVLSLVSPA